MIDSNTPASTKVRAADSVLNHTSPLGFGKSNRSSQADEEVLMEEVLMLSSAKRRVSMLERSIDLPLTAERLLARVEERVRLTGASYEGALEFVAGSLSTGNLERLADELLLQACGGDTVAKDEMKRKLKSRI